MDVHTLLVISRSPSLARRLQHSLGDEHCIRWVRSHVQALNLDLRPALLVHELPPSGGGRSTLRLKRRFGVPILVLRRADQPIPAAATASAARPIRVPQLVQAIDKALWSESPGVIRAPGMSLELKARRLQLGAGLHQLPPIPCQIIAVLMAEPGQVVTREELFRRVWSTNHSDSSRALDVHIAHLRRTLERDPRHPRLIVTERGIGYRLEPPDTGRV